MNPAEMCIQKWPNGQWETAPSRGFSMFWGSAKWELFFPSYFERSPFLYRLFSQAIIYTTLFAAIGVLSLLAAKNFSQILAVFNVQLHFCLILLIVALILWPMQLLRSPAHFWQVSIVAAVSTTLAVVLILIGAFSDLPQCYQVSRTRKILKNNFF